MDDYPVNNLPIAPLTGINELVCPKCGKSFVWYQTQIGEVAVGQGQPNCPYCGNNECRSKY